MTPSISKYTVIDDVIAVTTNDDDDHMDDTTHDDAEVSIIWSKSILDYLTNDILPDDIAEARRVHYKASRYVVIQGVLFKNYVVGPYLRRLDKDQRGKV